MKNLKLFLCYSTASALLVACASEAPPPQESLRLKISASAPISPQNPPPESTVIASIEKPAAQISCADVSNPAYRQSMLKAVNEIRSVGRSCGSAYFPAAAPLTWNNYLTLSAQEQANDMANMQVMSHQGATGMDFRQRIKITGYKGGGAENVASGQKNVAEVMHDWVELSAGHCSNIMRATFTHYALACAEDNTVKNRSYWAQHFGSGH